MPGITRAGPHPRFYLLLAQVVSLHLDLFPTPRHTDPQQDLEILRLRPPLRIVQHPHPPPPRRSRGEQRGLAVLAGRFTSLGRGTQPKLSHVLLLVKPDPGLKWHRDVVRRQWTFTNRRTAINRRTAGRPATAPELQTLLLQLAHENPTGGYRKRQGELLKRGYAIGRSTVRDILSRQPVSPAPERAKQGSSGRTFLRHYGQQMPACDFFTVETAWLQTLYVFFFIELGTRRVPFAGCTAHPTAEWVTQQARQLTGTWAEEQRPIRFLIRDRDANFTASFERVLETEGRAIIRTPYRAPRANAFAERWVRTVRAECLDRLLIVSQAHLRCVLQESIDYYNRARPHQGIQQKCPIPMDRVWGDGPVQRRDVLGGSIHDDHREAA